jgi:hypothetical protein
LISEWLTVHELDTRFVMFDGQVRQRLLSAKSCAGCPHRADHGLDVNRAFGHDAETLQ